jgi:hypothetical protein
LEVWPGRRRLGTSTFRLAVLERFGGGVVDEDLAGFFDFLVVATSGS